MDLGLLPRYCCRCPGLSQCCSFRSQVMEQRWDHAVRGIDNGDVDGCFLAFRVHGFVDLDPLDFFFASRVRSIHWGVNERRCLDGVIVLRLWVRWLLCASWSHRIICGPALAIIDKLGAEDNRHWIASRVSSAFLCAAFKNRRVIYGLIS